MDIKLPKEKIARIRQDIKSAKTKSRTARQIASLAGLLASTTPAVRPAFIFQRHLQRDPGKHLQRTNQEWEKVIPLLKETIEDLKKWEILLDVHNGLQVRIPPPDETVNIMTGASGTGWGIVSTHLTTHGRWTDQERKTSSNQKELRAILFALKLHTKHWKSKHIRIKTDNKTAVAYIQNQGGTVSLPLLNIATEIWEICLRHNIQITAEYLPGKRNAEADRESRQKSSQHEWQLPEEAWRFINRNWGEITIDLFASRNNTKHPRFFSMKPDPDAEAINALSQRWPTKGAYANPPWILLPRILREISLRELEEIVVITPTGRHNHG
ncbi:uncharacterized protein VTP21DRAFT_8113 [Calcarisporiella thermophila]|uniref:uncharacterized protein n=1 Tax=Calcarisporiella thermophila TaxID=911321 RepID=UPI0037449765